MRLSAVVIIMNAAGCVCEPKLEPKQAPGAPPSAGAAAAAGGALLASRQRQQLFSPSQPPHVPPPGLPWTPYGPRH